MLALKDPPSLKFHDRTDMYQWRILKFLKFVFCWTEEPEEAEELDYPKESEELEETEYPEDHEEKEYPEEIEYPENPWEGGLEETKYLKEPVVQRVNALENQIQLIKDTIEKYHTKDI